MKDLPVNEKFHENAVPAAGEQIRRLIERLAFQANRAAKAPSPDAIHDLRVAVRRTEQALLTFKPVLPRKAVKRVRKQLKAMMGLAGAVRDCDIAVRILLKTRRPEAAELRRQIRTRRKAAERSLHAGLRRLSLRTRISRWFADLQLHAQDEPQDEIRTIANDAVPRLTRRFFETGEAAAASHRSGEKLHEFRIQAKKLRYTLELFVPIYGPTIARWIDEIKAVQSILGKMNDYRSTAALAEKFGCSKNLKASLKRSERRKAREFCKSWGERFPQTAAAEWKRSLRAVEQESVPRKPVASATAARKARATA